MDSSSNTLKLEYPKIQFSKVNLSRCLNGSLSSDSYLTIDNSIKKWIQDFAFPVVCSANAFKKMDNDKNIFDLQIRMCFCWCKQTEIDCNILGAITAHFLLFSQSFVICDLFK